MVLFTIEQLTSLKEEFEATSGKLTDRFLEFTTYKCHDLLNIIEEFNKQSLMNKPLLQLAELMIKLGSQYEKDNLLALGEVIKADIWTK